MHKNVYRAIAVSILGTIFFGGTSLGSMTLYAKENTETRTVAGAGALFSEALKEEPKEEKEKEEVSVSEKEVETTKEPTEAVDTYGYKNLGIANVSETLNIREAPTTDAALVGKMPQKSAAEILETLSGWYKIQSGDVTGYVSSDFIVTGMEARSMAEDVKHTIATVKTTTLNVRQEPNTECSILALMPQGEELNVLEDKDGWIKVDVDDSQGYISKEFVDIAVQLPKAMTMTEVRYGEGVSDVRVDLVAYATQFVGNPYVWGGTSLTNGADCSGFTLSIFAKYGVYLPHSSRAQANCGTRIDPSEAKPGDLFFYGSGGGINHVAIYIGNGQIVHASNKRTGIKISNAFYRSPICVTRVLGD
ncbi:MAG: C40 family peptidase [Lachnospiraceae bacterium]|nr:C40 family peptidase [Lachnospiraceae bacterium]